MSDEREIAEEMGAAGIILQAPIHGTSPAAPRERAESPPPPQVPATHTPRRAAKRRVAWLRGLLIANAVASGALAFAFVGSSSDVRIVAVDESKPGGAVPGSRHFEHVAYLCVDDTIGSTISNYGNLSTGGGPCPAKAKPTAVVTTDNPWLFAPALVILMFSTLAQAFLIRADD